jgi:hypothetical protein
MLGSLFIGVTLLLPRGVVGTFRHWTGLRATALGGCRGRRHRTASRGMRMKAMEALTAALLYLDGVTVSFDGFKALNPLPRRRGRRDARHHRPERAGRPR